MYTFTFICIYMHIYTRPYTDTHLRIEEWSKQLQQSHHIFTVEYKRKKKRDTPRYLWIYSHIHMKIHRHIDTHTQTWPFSANDALNWLSIHYDMYSLHNVVMYIYICVYMYMYVYIYTLRGEGWSGFPGYALWYRVVKTHKIPYLYRSFSAKELYI